MTLEKYLETWLLTYIRPNKAKNTEKSYRYAFAHIPVALMGCELASLEPLEIQMAINQTAAEAPRQAQLMYAGMRAALNRAVKLRILEHSPMVLVEKPNHEKAEICYLLPEEARKYFAACGTIEYGWVLQLMICLGLRRNELRGLRWSDLEGNTLHIRHQRIKDELAPLKSKASRRDLVIPDGLTLGHGQPDEFFYPYSENSLRRLNEKALRLAGVEKRVTLHGLRHTCATTAIFAGCPMLTVQHLLGHSHFSVTSDTYCHVDRVEITAATKSIYNSVQPRLAC